MKKLNNNDKDILRLSGFFALIIAVCIGAAVFLGAKNTELQNGAMKGQAEELMNLVSDAAKEFSAADEIASAVENSTLASLRGTESTVMPKASAYALLEQSSSGISKMVYNGRNITYSGNKWVDDVDFEEHDSVAGFLAADITGKVRLKVAHDNIGTYVVTIDTVNVT